MLAFKLTIANRYCAGNNEIEFKFTDNISVYDCIIPSKVLHKGEILCKTSAFWFSKLNKMQIKIILLINSTNK